mmetsp:Transcript_17465/g.54652  ORF Transcript_17465/g.54652 Transcript_17465/m.54652 type:complete len:394 (+) Transcript_17465:58-1239(+)
MDARLGPEPETRQERARQLAADQALQSLLVNYGLVEDWEARILDELARPDENTAESSVLSGHSATLRRMRRTGALGELDETYQSTLLGSTLYRFSRDVPPVRAADVRLHASSPVPEGTLAATRTLGDSGMQETLEGAGTLIVGATQALANLRHCIERLLQQGITLGGTIESRGDGDRNDLSSSLGSTVLGARGRGPIGDLGSTVGMLEGHLSPLEETTTSVISGTEGDLAQTQGSIGDFRHLELGGLHRDPARETTDSWGFTGSRDLDQTGRTVFSGSMANLAEGDRTGMLLRLLNAADFDESLVRSIHRVLQLGSVLAGDRLSESDIESLPKVNFDQKEEQQCSICLEAFATGELLTQLPCSHFFHVECVSRWFRQSTQCPLCRGQCGAEGT